MSSRPHAASHKVRRSRTTRRAPANSRSQRPPAEPARTLTPQELEEIRRLMKEQFGGKDPRPFQLDMVQSQEERRDALCQAATGQGKTAIAAGPYALPQNQDKVTLMISPLIGLQNEMVQTFRNEFNLAAVAVNSSHGGCTDGTLDAIIHGDYRIVLISPEMLVSRRFIDRVLRNHAFASRIYSVVIDEAHCISHWGAEFRKKYGEIGMIRAFLPRTVPFIAVSASLTRRVTRDIINKLQLNRGPFLHKNLGNDRGNVSLAVRAIHHPISSYVDLDFVIPSGVRVATDIPKTWIYADNITNGSEIIDHLRTLLPDNLHGVIRPYNAAHDNEYRDQAMALFRSGEIRVLMCTDAAGMGCNILDIERVVQWKLPGKLSSFVQRAGRAARAPDTQGLAVLLVEPSAYSTDLGQGDRSPETAKTPSKGKSRSAPKAARKKANDKNYARSRGRFRGGPSGHDDPVPPGSETPPVDEDDTTEGLLHFVQTTQCRREVLRQVFDNPEPAPTVPCCDICAPNLLDRIRPGRKSSVTAGPRLTYDREPTAARLASLYSWREDVFALSPSYAFMTPEAILPDEAIEKIAKLKGPLTAITISGVLARSWPLWTQYQHQLTTHLLGPSTALTAPQPIAPHDSVSATEAQGSGPPSESSTSLDPNTGQDILASAPPPSPVLQPPRSAKRLQASRDDAVDGVANLDTQRTLGGDEDGSARARKKPRTRAPDCSPLTPTPTATASQTAQPPPLPAPTLSHSFQVQSYVHSHAAPSSSSSLAEWRVDPSQTSHASAPPHSNRTPSTPVSRPPSHSLRAASTSASFQLPPAGPALSFLPPESPSQSRPAPPPPPSLPLTPHAYPYPHTAPFHQPYLQAPSPFVTPPHHVPAFQNLYTPSSPVQHWQAAPGPPYTHYYQGYPGAYLAGWNASFSGAGPPQPGTPQVQPHPPSSFGG